MDVAHVGLVHCDRCECKVKGFYAVSSIERNVSMKGCHSDNVHRYEYLKAGFHGLHHQMQKIHYQ